jgi:hypothetical protein
MPIPDLGNIAAAVGALGAASFALVDATKIGRNGGVSHSGFGFIESGVRQLMPDQQETKLLSVLHSNWINGAPLGDQKAIAKSLLKLRLTPATAESFARATNVDAGVLRAVATSMVNGDDLTQPQANALGRFDLALTAALDDAYQHADQRYRNAAKVLAAIVAVVLALLGGWAMWVGTNVFFGSQEMWVSLMCGLLAIPLAPVSKDLTSALAAGVKVAQALKR